MVRDIFKNKGKKLYTQSKEGRAFHASSKTEYLNTQVMYESYCNKVKLKFARNAVIGCGGTKQLVMMDPYNTLEAEINKDIFGYRGALILVTNA